MIACTELLGRPRQEACQTAREMIGTASPEDEPLLPRMIVAVVHTFGNTLTLRRTLVLQWVARAALVNALEEANRLSNARYNAGIDSYLSVLVAQGSMFAAQQSLISTRLAEQANVVTLYKVLGGGIEEVSGPTGPVTGAARSHSASIW